ncbi:TadE/TadG family type IV pilus assembly protein [Kallotenue papyrolyticum]|uniref:TadE/TadG family type IV pilus assembly protein n=1 Tax=Kallotenue papyrolyticum TaxID=1325125 RepID=UPI00047857BF|nr:TadE/TadG family type IV pilus assembly protein [Kallotenue papyrolyticum]
MSRLISIWQRWQTRRAVAARQPGQALVELALAATFLTLLLSAAVDLGLAYKAYQTLMSATAEASNYLQLRPLASCDPSRDGTNCAQELADMEARIRFRGEQGDRLGRFASTLDLNANGRDDRSEFGSDAAWLAYIRARVRIDEADSTQVTITNSGFAVGDTFDPTRTSATCQERHNRDANGQCFIVVRTSIDYVPFAIAPIVGRRMTIRAISVQPITNGHP